MHSLWKRRTTKIIPIIVILILLGLLWHMGRVEVIEAESGYLAPSSDDEGTIFTAAAYNVQARPWFDDSKHKFTYISPILNAYGIVAVQECFKDHRRLWDGTDHPVKIYQGTLHRPWKLVGSGLSTLAKYPLLEVETYHYSAGGNFENSLASKGIILTRLDINGIPLDVYNTHMVAARVEPSMVARRIQGRELIDFVNRHTPPDAPLVFLGDFNMRHSRGDDIPPHIAAGKVPESFNQLTQTQIFAAILLALNLTDAGEELNGPEFDGVDHVLYRSGKHIQLTALSCKRDDPAFYDPEGAALSDHKPLIAEFRLFQDEPAVE